MIRFAMSHPALLVSALAGRPSGMCIETPNLIPRSSVRRTVQRRPCPASVLGQGLDRIPYLRSIASESTETAAILSALGKSTASVIGAAVAPVTGGGSSKQ
jgi:hypothetical protein